MAEADLERMSVHSRSCGEQEPLDAVMEEKLDAVEKNAVSGWSKIRASVKL